MITIAQIVSIGMEHGMDYCETVLAIERGEIEIQRVILGTSGSANAVENRCL